MSLTLNGSRDACSLLIFYIDGIKQVHLIRHRCNPHG